jgi:hypothetical protein
VRAHFNPITIGVPSLTQPRVGYSIAMSEDIGAVRRFPLALLMQHTTPGPRRALRIVFPSDENNRAQQWCCKGSGPFRLGPASGDVSAYGDVLSNKAATELPLFRMKNGE